MQIWERNAFLPGFLFSKRTGWIPAVPLSHTHFGNLQHLPPWEQHHHAASRQKRNRFAESFLHRTLLMSRRRFPQSLSVNSVVFNISAKPYYTVIFQTQTKILIWAKSRTFPPLKSWTFQTQCATVATYILLWCRIPASLRNAPISRHNTIQFFNWVK